MLDPNLPVSPLPSTLVVLVACIFFSGVVLEDGYNKSFFRKGLKFEKAIVSETVSETVSEMQKLRLKL